MESIIKLITEKTGISEANAKTAVETVTPGFASRFELSDRRSSPRRLILSAAAANPYSTAADQPSERGRRPPWALDDPGFPLARHNP